MRAAALVLTFALAAACGHESATHTTAQTGQSDERFQGSFSPPPAPPKDAEVVATVNGEHIYAADVAAQMRARGQDAATALHELVDAELIAQAARARGLQDDPDVVEARKRERVRAYLAREFEPGHSSPKDVPQADVDAAFEAPRNHRRFDHPEYRVAAHVITKHDATGKISEDQARGVAHAFYQAALAARPKTRDEFMALAPAVSAKEGVLIQPAEPDMYTTEHEGPAVPEFAAAAFSLSGVGAISPPVRTDYGWHVLYLTSIIPAVHLSRAEADEVLRKEIFELWRRGAFVRFADKLRQGHTVVRHDDVLSKIDVDSLVGLP